MKTIITHIGPDLDAITSIWLIKRFLPGWKEAGLAFVPAGSTLEGKPPDANPDILHVDTGFGEYDHHQTNEDTCASLLIYQTIKDQKGEDPALERFLQIVNDIDHFREVYFPNPTGDFWDIAITSQIDGWRLIYAEDPLKVVALGLESIEAIYKTFQNKVWAEKEIKEKGRVFDTKWGRTLGVETTNDEVVHLGQKMGFAVVVRKDPKKGYLRIKALPREDIDLQPLYNKLQEAESQATWFLHASHHMILNGSTKNPDMRPSKKSLEEIINIMKGI